MSALSFGSQIAEVLQAHAVLGRLGLLSLELLVLGLGVAGLIWLLRIRAPRMRALLWLLVLSLCLVFGIGPSFHLLWVPNIKYAKESFSLQYEEYKMGIAESLLRCSRKYSAVL